jgi:hypothetical protein
MKGTRTNQQTHVVMTKRLPTTFMWASLLSLVLPILPVSASPLIQNVPQKPFNLPTQDSKAVRLPANDGLWPSLDFGLEALSEASSQPIDTFEAVMLELGDTSKWSLPKKEARPRLVDWDFTVSTSGLPQHSLRVKQPNSLGVDDVKQVYTYYLFVMWN